MHVYALKNIAYMSFSDASKALDRVNHRKLFIQLIQKCVLIQIYVF